jgi:CRISPR-associated protein Csm4
MKAVKLEFKTPVRIGETGIGLESVSEVIHSDTLFSAIANALADLNEDVMEFIEKVSNGELRISSALPFKRDRYYLPAPVKPYEKKIDPLVPKEVFEELLICDEVGKEVEKEKPYKEFELPKVAVDRVTANTNIYYVSLLKFDNGGFYFLVEGNGRRLIELALRYLADEGIGGKRTWGLGRFEFEFTDFSLKTPKDANAFVTLSVVFPQNLKSIKFWKPLIRGGWTFSRKGRQMRKPGIIMASEGSIFGEREEGKVVDLDEIVEGFSAKVGRKVFVNGKSFLVPAVVGYGD